MKISEAVKYSKSTLGEIKAISYQSIKHYIQTLFHFSSLASPDAGWKMISTDPRFSDPENH